MRIQILLNKVHPLKSFVYAACRLELRNAGPVLVAKIRPRLNGKVLCSGCLIAAITLADESAHPSLSFTPSNIAQLQENVNSGLLGPVRLVQENRIVLERE